MQKKQKGGSWIGRSATGVGISLLLSVLLSGVACIIIMNGWMEEKSIELLANVIQGISVFVGVAAACRDIKEKHVILCVLTGGLYWLCLVALTAAFCNAKYSGVLTAFIVIIVVSVISGIMCANRSAGGRKRRSFRSVSKKIAHSTRR